MAGLGTWTAVAAFGAIVTYPTIAAAEAAIVAAGYKRDVQRALWVNVAGKTAKVKYDSPGKFYVEWA